MIDRIEIKPGAIGWREAAPLLAATWPPEVMATLPWRDVLEADPDWHMLGFDRIGGLVAHIGLFLRDGLWNDRAVRIAGIGGVATRVDRRRQGVASTMMRRAAEEMGGTHEARFG